MHIMVLALLMVVPACTRDDAGTSYRGARVITVDRITFDDGDTFDVNGETIRILGIDTPEIAHPEMGQMEGQPYGDAASDSVMAWLQRAHTIEIVRDGRGFYGRRLAHVFIDGKLLAIMLIEHGLAYETVSHYGDSGFPDLAQQIYDASLVAPTPPFEAPYKWKKRQRKKREKGD